MRPPWVEAAVLAGVVLLVALALVGMAPALGEEELPEPEPACAVLAERILGNPQAIPYWTDESAERASRVLYQKGALRFDVLLTWNGEQPCFAGARQLGRRP